MLILAPPPASMAFSGNPLVPPREGVAVPAGLRFVDTIPPSKVPLVLRVNGEFVLRAQWELVIESGDVVEWHAVPGGGNANSRSILTAVVVIAAFAIGFFTGGATWSLAAGMQYAGYASLAMSLFNALVPVKQQDSRTGATPGSVYSVQLASNQARLHQPIPVIYGRMRTFPDYAAQPYNEFIQNEQFFHALYCIGQGEYVQEAIEIGNTDLSVFKDVTFNWLPPGTAPTLVLGNVVNSMEVAGQDIRPNQFVGPFVVCGPGERAKHVGYDIVFQNGLGDVKTDGTVQGWLVVIRVDAQVVDDWGVPAGDWFQLRQENITGDTTTPLRFSFKDELPTPARVQLRYIRIGAFTDNQRVLNSPSLGGQRAYLDGPVPLAASATHLEVRIRASAQLSQFAQNRISVIVRRLLRQWNGAYWTAPVETRSIAWALADAWTNPVYGDGLPDARVDLQTLHELDQVWAARQDRFDHLFDAKLTSWDVASMIAQAGRAKPFRRYGVCTLVRDQLRTLPVTAFTSRNMLPGMDVGYTLANEVTADGVLVEYFSNRTWQWETILCRAPGVANPVSAPRLRLGGITGAKQAEREGLYQAAQNVYRRKFFKWQTELAGLLPAYGSMVLYAGVLPGTGQAGDVTEWDESMRVLELSEPPVFDPAAPGHSITLLRDNGSVAPAIACLPGPTATSVVLAALPDFQLYLKDAGRERPKYVFGPTALHRAKVLVLGITNRGPGENGATIVEMAGVAENDAIHLVDAHLLPSPSEVQDPIDRGVSQALAFSQVVNVSAATNAGTSSAVGVVLSGVDPSWTLRISMPALEAFSGWSPWSSDHSAGVPSPPNAWGNSFKVTADGVTSTFGADAIAVEGAAAAAFSPVTVAGSSTYVFWIEDLAGTGDNRGGVSLLVERI